MKHGKDKERKNDKAKAKAKEKPNKSAKKEKQRTTENHARKASHGNGDGGSDINLCDGSIDTNTEENASSFRDIAQRLKSSTFKINYTHGSAASSLKQRIKQKRKTESSHDKKQNILKHSDRKLLNKQMLRKQNTSINNIYDSASNASLLSSQNQSPSNLNAKTHNNSHFSSNYTISSPSLHHSQVSQINLAGKKISVFCFFV